MLNIYLGNMENVIFHPPTYFDNTYEDEWITDPLSIEMIKDVDKSVVVSSHLINSPVLGPIPPVNLSGGVKTLMLMALCKMDLANCFSKRSDNQFKAHYGLGKSSF